MCISYVAVTKARQALEALIREKLMAPSKGPLSLEGIAADQEQCLKDAEVTDRFSLKLWVTIVEDGQEQRGYFPITGVRLGNWKPLTE
jgi:hypothetical protein